MSCWPPADSSSPSSNSFPDVTRRSRAASHRKAPVGAGLKPAPTCLLARAPWATTRDRPYVFVGLGVRRVWIRTKFKESNCWGFTRAERIRYHILFMARRARCALARLQVICKHRTDPDSGSFGLRLALGPMVFVYDRAGKVSRRTEACSFQRES